MPCCTTPACQPPWGSRSPTDTSSPTHARRRRGAGVGQGRSFSIQERRGGVSASHGAQSTADEVLEGVDLSGKRVLVTGVTSGIGVETVRALAAHGAQVVGTYRDREKAFRVSEIVRAEAAPDGGLELVPLNLSSLASVRSCADVLLAAGDPFDAVIANAGVICPKSMTVDGFE